MKLLNIDEEAPDEFFIFVNQSNPMTEHNFQVTKTFTSGAANSCCMDPKFEEKYLNGTARYLPYEPCSHDNVSPSPYLLTAINDYRIEFDFEVYREKHHPLYPSRLSALYAFGDFSTCQKVSQKHKWDLSSVKTFKLKDWPLTRIVKVNMEHISLARHAYRVSMIQDLNRLWAGYWAAFGEIVIELPSSPRFQRKQYPSGITWEYLIEGIAVHCNN